MQVDDRTSAQLHNKLPIDPDEKILNLYRHHWFAYASVWIFGIIMVLVVMGAAVLLSSNAGGASVSSQGQSAIIIGAGVLSALIMLGTFVPVYLRSQEQLVLTDEALLQVLQPSLFASKVNQLNLQHIADVAVRQDFFGTIFGYGHLTVETPGEQNNYIFSIIGTPHAIAREIIAAHEDYEAALESGRLPTSFEGGTPPPPQIDMKEYQEFLAFQQTKQAAQSSSQQDAPQADDPTKQN